MPLSGEGLFVRTSVLREVGGFPEVLTEDAYLGIILTERGKRFGLVRRSSRKRPRGTSDPTSCRDCGGIVDT